MGDEKPLIIEVDDPSRFYLNSLRYNGYTKLKHQMLTRSGYRVVHVPYCDWDVLGNRADATKYMRAKLKEADSDVLTSGEVHKVQLRSRPTPRKAPDPPSKRSASPRANLKEADSDVLNSGEVHKVQLRSGPTSQKTKDPPSKRSASPRAKLKEADSDVLTSGEVHKVELRSGPTSRKPPPPPPQLTMSTGIAARPPPPSSALPAKINTMAVPI